MIYPSARYHSSQPASHAAAAGAAYHWLLLMQRGTLRQVERYYYLRSQPI